MRQCPQCGRTFGLDITFCLHDGALLEDAPDTQQTLVRPASTLTREFQAAPKSPPKKGGSARELGFAALIIGVIFGGLFLVKVIIDSQEKKSLSSESTTSSQTVVDPPQTPAYSPRPVRSNTPTPQPRPASVDLVAGPMTVDPLTFRQIPFTIADTGYQGVVVGKYEAWGGKDDINVVVLAASELSSFRNLGSYRYYYNPGYIHSDRLKLRLAPGDYVLIFNNRSAVLTSKSVEAYIELRYE